MVRGLLASALVVAAGACSTDPHPTLAGAEGRVVKITMTEFGFSPRTITVTAGETVTFHLVNAGAIEHELMVGTHPTPSRGYANDWLKGAAPALAAHSHPGEEHLGEGVRVPADWSSTVKLVIPLEKGTYEFGCFIAGHYEAGMRGTLVVR